MIELTPKAEKAETFANHYGTCFDVLSIQQGSNGDAKVTMRGHAFGDVVEVAKINGSVLVNGERVGSWE